MCRPKTKWLIFLSVKIRIFDINLFRMDGVPELQASQEEGYAVGRSEEGYIIATTTVVRRVRNRIIVT